MEATWLLFLVRILLKRNWKSRKGMQFFWCFWLCIFNFSHGSWLNGNEDFLSWSCVHQGCWVCFVLMTVAWIFLLSYFAVKVSITETMISCDRLILQPAHNEDFVSILFCRSSVLICKSIFLNSS